MKIKYGTVDENIFSYSYNIDDLMKDPLTGNIGSVYFDDSLSFEDLDFLNDKIMPIEFDFLSLDIGSVLGFSEDMIFDNQDITSVIFDNGAIFSANGNITINGESII